MKRKIIIQRGEKEDYFMHEFEMESGPGMVVLDAIHEIQANDAPDLAVRWNCKAGKCGSCSAEVNGVPSLMCMTRMSDTLHESKMQSLGKHCLGLGIFVPIDVCS